MSSETPVTKVAADALRPGQPTPGMHREEAEALTGDTGKILARQHVLLGLRGKEGGRRWPPGTDGKIGG